MSAEKDQTDYTQAAQNMLQMWQQSWKSFSDAMSAAPMPQSETNDASHGKTSAPPQDWQNVNWLEPWGKIMASWAATTPAPTAEDANAAPQNEQQPTPREPIFKQPAAAPAAAAPNAFAASDAMAPAHKSAPDARDVLFAELARRVEFLHERLVKMESELEKLKRRI